MEDSGQEKSHSVQNWAAGIAVSLVLYVLSIGPVIAMSASGRLPRRLDGVLMIVYYPIIYLHDYIPIRSPLEKYVGWWEKVFFRR